MFSPFPKRAGVVAHELKQEVELGSRMMEELASVSFFANTIARLESLRGCTGRQLFQVAEKNRRLCSTHAVPGPVLSSTRIAWEGAVVLIL